MKSAPAIIATQLARATLRSVIRSPVPRIAFMMRRAAGLLERRNFVVERLPLAVENMRARDDNVDLLRAGFHASGESPPRARPAAKARREIRQKPQPPECPLPPAPSPPSQQRRDTRRPRPRSGAAPQCPAPPRCAAAADCAPWRTAAARGRRSRRRSAWSGPCRRWRAAATPPGSLFSRCAARRCVAARRSTALVFTRTWSTHSRFSGMRRFGSSVRPFRTTGIVYAWPLCAAYLSAFLLK